MQSVLGYFKDPEVNIFIERNTKLEGYRDRFLKTELPIFTRGDKVSGIIEVTPPVGRSIVHQGVQLNLVGEYRKFNGESISRFYTRKQELLPKGELMAPLKTNFAFDNVNFTTCSYKGTAVNVVFFIELKIVRRMIDFKVEAPFTVVIFTPRPQKCISTHNEVGIRNILHIEFVFPHNMIDSVGCALGAVFFILVKIRIVHMELMLYRVENYTSDEVYFKKKTILKTFEIMDGAPVRGECIPIRFYLGDANIWPFHHFKDSKLKVEHYIKAKLRDENNKGYYKRLKVDFTRFEPLPEHLVVP